MISVPAMALWLLAGVLTGAFFFSGLQLTVKKAVHSEKPGRVFLLSFLLRFTAVVPVFLLAARGNPLALTLCFVGFMVARQAILRKAKTSAKEEQYAS